MRVMPSSAKHINVWTCEYGPSLMARCHMTENNNLIILFLLYFILLLNFAPELLLSTPVGS